MVKPVKTVKVGVLGFGTMGQRHLKNCLLMKDVKVTVADTSKSALRKAKDIGIKEVYSNYLELIQKGNVDAVVVTLPNFLHVESSCLAAESGLDVFVEKPLGRTAEECKSITQSAKKNDVKLMVGFYQRFLSTTRILKSKIDSGILGDIELVAYELIGSGAFSHRFPPSRVPKWWFDVEMVGGGALIDTGSHMIDLTRWMLNDEASVQNVFLGYKFRLPQEDTVILSLRFKNGGTKAVLMMGWFAMDTTQRIAIYGTAGSTLLEGIAQSVSTKQIIEEGVQNVAKRVLGKRIEPYSLSYVSKAYFEELEHFIDCVRNDTQPSVTGEDGLACAKLIDEAYQLWRSTSPSDKE
jgi:predicted dehydrogenase